MTRSADIIVVGAGVIGASIAFQLAQREVGRVVVLDRKHVAAGMSSRSSALIRMHYTFPQEVQLAVRSREMFLNWPDITGAPSYFRQIGFVQIVPASETKLLRQNVKMQKALGVDTELITGPELKQIEPDWNVEDVEVAAYEAASGYGDGATTATDLLSAARRKGAEYLPRTRVTGILCRNGRVRGVRTDDEDVEAPEVVCAAGPWSPSLLGKTGFELPIETEYHQTLVLRNLPAMKSAGSACIDSVTGVYFRSEGPDMTLVGTFAGPRGMDPDTLSDTGDDGTTEAILTSLVWRVPACADAGIAHVITGIYDVTPDGRPLLGAVPGIDGLHLAAGFSGTGFKISPAVGLCMAELILDGRAHTVDLAPFRPSRFAEGEPIIGRYQYREE